jgi:CBS-domain-containing membrane protein
VTARHLKADVMTKPVVTMVNQTPVDVLVALMRRRTVKHAERQLVGVVSPTDLLEALLRRADAADEER